MSKELMVVDDSRMVYASMSKMLENSGWEIAQLCKNGEEALKTYLDIQPDVVTIDIVMPGMDGLETARRLLEKWPAAKILFVSSLAYDEVVAQPNALSAKGLLYKPFHRGKFLTELADIVSVQWINWPRKDRKPGYVWHITRFFVGLRRSLTRLSLLPRLGPG